MICRTLVRLFAQKFILRGSRGARLVTLLQIESFGTNLVIESLATLSHDSRSVKPVELAVVPRRERRQMRVSGMFKHSNIFLQHFSRIH